MEAIGQQVSLLRTHFPGSIAWGLNRQRVMRLSWRRGFICHPRLWLPFRSVTSLLQQVFQVNHIVGGLQDWFYLRAANKRPIVLTAAVRSSACDEQLLKKVDQFIVEWKSDVQALVSQGVQVERIRVIPPPIDLERFSPSAAPSGPFTIVFASSPDAADSLTDRGIDALLDAATLRPDYRFLLLWRPWGDSYPTVRRWIGERRLSNVEVVHQSLPRIEDTYRAIHATVAPFRNPATTKSVPNSLIESLACGRPIVATPTVSIAADVERMSAGRCVAPTGDSLALAFDDIRQRWGETSRNARHFAESHFSQSTFVESHRELYLKLMQSNYRNRNGGAPHSP
jgi:glycosyltransferase involved in cell wall biosynthesis